MYDSFHSSDSSSWMLLPFWCGYKLYLSMHSAAAAPAGDERPLQYFPTDSWWGGRLLLHRKQLMTLSTCQSWRITIHVSLCVKRASCSYLSQSIGHLCLCLSGGWFGADPWMDTLKTRVQRKIRLHVQNFLTILGEEVSMIEGGSMWLSGNGLW